MCFDGCQFAFYLYCQHNGMQKDKKTLTQLSPVCTNVYTIIFKFNVIIIRFRSMLMKISFNVCCYYYYWHFGFTVLTYHAVLWCSYDTEQQICQDSSVSVTGTRLDNQVLASGFLDVLMALRCTTLPFLYLLIFIKVKT